MRNKLLLLIALFSVSLIYAQCNYKLELDDNFGDGWNSNGSMGEVELVIAGVSTPYTIATGTGSPRTIEFDISVNDGDSYEIIYTPTQIPADASFRLYDSEDILVYDSGPFLSVPPDTTVDSGTISCPTCPAVDNVVSSSVQPRQVELSWDLGGTETEWEVEFGSTGFALGNGNVEIANTNVSYVLDNLAPETTYDVYVRSRCSATDVSTSRGPETFTTLPSCPRPAAFSEVAVNPNDVSFLITDTGGNLNNTGFYQIGVAPFTLGSAVEEPISTLPFVRIDQLMSNTTYEVFVRFDCGGGDLSAYSDDSFIFTTPQNCDDIAAPVVSNETFSSVDLSWTASDATQTEWEVEYGEAPLDSSNSTTLTVTSPMAVLSALSSATNYEYCITGVCSPLDRAMPVCGTFSTPTDYCGADPLVDSGGISGNYSNNENITYTICPENAGDIVTINFTEFDVEAGSNTNCFDTVTIYDGDSTAAPRISPSGTPTSWCFNRATGIGTGDLTLANIQATSASGCITVVFASDGANVASGFLATVECEAPPACPEPDQLAISQIYGAGANILWNSNGSEQQWEVEVQPTGSPQGTAGAAYAATVAQTQENITGLVPNTSYDAYVRANCQSGDLSVWVGPRTFTTGACDVITAPYTGAGGSGAGNTFDPFPGDCWFEVNNTLISQIPVRSNSAWEDFDYANDSSSPNGNAALIPFFPNGPSNNDWLVSPTFDLGAPGHNLLLNYVVALTEAFEETPSNFDADDNVTLYISNDNGLSWNAEAVYNAASNIQPSGSRAIIDLAAYSGEIKFAFVSSFGPGSNANTTADIEFFVDEIRIATTASINSISDTPNVSIFPNPTAGDLNINSEGSIDSIDIYNLLGQNISSIKYKGETSVSFDTAGLKSGIYLVTVNTEHGAETLRFVKK
ncbi:MAG: T9SS type A sorting domain-containing protein [Nonlabens sp.]